MCYSINFWSTYMFFQAVVLHNPPNLRITPARPVLNPNPMSVGLNWAYYADTQVGLNPSPNLFLFFFAQVQSGQTFYPTQTILVAPLCELRAYMYEVYACMFGYEFSWSMLYNMCYVRVNNMFYVASFY